MDYICLQEQKNKKHNAKDAVNVFIIHSTYSTIPPMKQFQYMYSIQQMLFSNKYPS